MYNVNGNNVESIFLFSFFCSLLYSTTITYRKNKSELSDDSGNKDSHIPCTFMDDQNGY